MHHKNSNAGFTLVELAIVLVIIGLIVGGVLVGQDLIKAATMQKAVKQIGDTEAAANTFRTKYNDLPGDLRNAASVFSGNTAGNVSNKGMGNADGLIQATSDGAGAVTASLGASGETAAFYSQISQAGYVKEQITTTVDISKLNYAKAVINATDNTALFLPLILGKGAKLVVGSDGTKNYIVVVGNSSGAAAAGIPTWTGGLEPLQASSIDTKLDDGKANTGNVVNGDPAAPAPGTPDAGNTCADATTGLYASTSTTQTCNIAIRTSF